MSTAVAQGGGKLESIEAGRGVAALAVTLYHATRIIEPQLGALPLGGLFLAGHAGVDFFFVLSGFIILWSHRRDLGAPRRIGGYAWRRLSRILPAYWIATALVLALLVASPGAGLPDPGLLLRSLLLVPGTVPVLDVGWSLVHEIVFYAAFALCILHRGLGLAVFAAWLAVILGGMVSAGTVAAMPAILVNGYNIGFFLGMAAALVLARGTVPLARTSAVVGGGLFLGAMLLAGVLPSGGQGLSWRIAFAAAATVVVLGCAGADRLGAWRVPRPLVRLGAASYSLYLVHAPVLIVAVEIVERLDLHALVPIWAIFWAVSGVSVVAALAFWTWVEQPLLRLCRRQRPIAARKSPAHAA